MKFENNVPPISDEISIKYLNSVYI